MMMTVEWTVHAPVVTIPPRVASLVPWIAPCTARPSCAGIFISDGVGCAAVSKVSCFLFKFFHRVGLAH